MIAPRLPILHSFRNVSSRSSSPIVEPLELGDEILAQRDGHHPARKEALHMEVAVIVPTLNEAGNIARLIDAVLQADPRLHVIVVDDGSNDGTDTLVEDKARETRAEGGQRAHLIERGAKKGYASAVQDGMRYALKHGAQLVLQMDADWSHDPKYLPAILAKSASCDLVIGSRYIKGGGTRNWGLDRKILSGGANRLARTLLGLRTRDCTGGFRCWKRELIERSGVLDAKVQGYAFLFVTLDKCQRLNAKIGEVPIIFADREFGKSKMSRRIVMEAMTVLFGLWWKRVSGR